MKVMRVVAGCVCLAGVVAGPGLWGAESGGRAGAGASEGDRGLRLVVAAPGSNELRGDLAGDGRVLVVRWGSASGSDAVGAAQQVTVAEESGHVLWSSPVPPDAPEDQVFGTGESGSTLPEALVDADGDGRLELLAPSPKASSGAREYRMFRWTGTEFKLVRTWSLVASGGMDTLFQWQKSNDRSQYWVERWVEPKGDAAVSVVVVRETDSGQRMEGVAELVRDGQRYLRETWIRRPARAAP